MCGSQNKCCTKDPKIGEDSNKDGSEQALILFLLESTTFLLLILLLFLVDVNGRQSARITSSLTGQWFCCCLVIFFS